MYHQYSLVSFVVIKKLIKFMVDTLIDTPQKILLQW